MEGSGAPAGARRDKMGRYAVADSDPPATAISPDPAGDGTRQVNTDIQVPQPPQPSPDRGAADARAGVETGRQEYGAVQPGEPAPPGSRVMDSPRAQSNTAPQIKALDREDDYLFIQGEALPTSDSTRVAIEALTNDGSSVTVAARWEDNATTGTPAKFYAGIPLKGCPPGTDHLRLAPFTQDKNQPASVGRPVVAAVQLPRAIATPTAMPSEDVQSPNTRQLRNMQSPSTRQQQGEVPTTTGIPAGAEPHIPAGRRPADAGAPQHPDHDPEHPEPRTHEKATLWVAFKTTDGGTAYHHIVTGDVSLTPPLGAKERRPDTPAVSATVATVAPKSENSWAGGGDASVDNASRGTATPRRYGEPPPAIQFPAHGAPASSGNPGGGGTPPPPCGSYAATPPPTVGCGAGILSIGDLVRVNAAGGAEGMVVASDGTSAVVTILSSGTNVRLPISVLIPEQSAHTAGVPQTPAHMRVHKILDDSLKTDDAWTVAGPSAHDNEIATESPFRVHLPEHTAEQVFQATGHRLGANTPKNVQAIYGQALAARERPETATGRSADVSKIYVQATCGDDVLKNPQELELLLDAVQAAVESPADRIALVMHLLSKQNQRSFRDFTSRQSFGNPGLEIFVASSWELVRIILKNIYGTQHVLHRRKEARRLEALLQRSSSAANRVIHTTDLIVEIAALMASAKYGTAVVQPKHDPSNAESANIFLDAIQPGLSLEDTPVNGHTAMWILLRKRQQHLAATSRPGLTLNGILAYLASIDGDEALKIEILSDMRIPAHLITTALMLPIGKKLPAAPSKTGGGIPVGAIGDGPNGGGGGGHVNRPTGNSHTGSRHWYNDDKVANTIDRWVKACVACKRAGKPPNECAHQMFSCPIAVAEMKNGKCFACGDDHSYRTCGEIVKLLKEIDQCSRVRRGLRSDNPGATVVCAIVGRMLEAHAHADPPNHGHVVERALCMAEGECSHTLDLEAPDLRGPDLRG